MKTDLIIIETTDKCCANCVGTGEECEKGFAWIYCKTRADNDEQFDGDCGGTLGCNRFVEREANEA